MASGTTFAPRPRPRPISSAIALLDSARDSLSEAAAATTPAARYVASHLAALRAAAAVLATETSPQRPRSRQRPPSVWVLLPKVAPAFGEWAAFFAAGARKRAAAEAGIYRAVSVREADDLLRDAETFIALVESELRLSHAATSAGDGAG